MDQCVRGIAEKVDDTGLLGIWEKMMPKSSLAAAPKPQQEGDGQAGESRPRTSDTLLGAHAGYTRVHNPITEEKDLVRPPGLVAIAYQHETSRCGDARSRCLAARKPRMALPPIVIAVLTGRY